MEKNKPKLNMKFRFCFRGGVWRTKEGGHYFMKGFPSHKVNVMCAWFYVLQGDTRESHASPESGFIICESFIMWHFPLRLTIFEIGNR